MAEDFRINIGPKCPKYNESKWQATQTRKGQEEGSYQIYTFGYNGNNQKINQSRLIFENDRMTKEEYDFDLDNVPDATTEWKYDKQGNMIECDYDYDGDGKLDCVEKSRYDEKGNMTIRGIDRDMDGKADKLNYMEYDENNNMTSYKTDEDADGMVDYAMAISYDEFGRKSKVLIDNKNDGIYDEQDVLSYNEEGWLESSEKTYMQNGFTTTYRTEFDKEGNIILNGMK